MKLSFRQTHLFRIIEFFEKSNLPIDLFLKNYFFKHKQLGSTDRKEICSTIYPMIRFKGLIEYYSKRPFTPQNLFDAYQRILNTQMDENIPLNIQVSFPLDYFLFIKKNFGLEKTLEICHLLNERAPTTIRINPLKTTRQNLYTKWKEKYPVQLGSHSSLAIHFKEKIPFFTLPEFKDGFFEIQDEGSQLISELVEAKPKDHILDYCAGAGGKSLAIAHLLEGKGQIYLYDVRTQALQEAKKRLKRAGVQNSQIILTEQNLNRIRGKMDWVLTDVPCSGSGTLRRNPDMKWRFSTHMIENLVLEQRQIFEKAQSFVKEYGHIVYATCSLFPEENEKQVKFFLDTFPQLQLIKMVSWIPEKEGMDGFFGAVFQKK